MTPDLENLCNEIDEGHECTQKLVLTTMCMSIMQITRDVAEIKETQKDIVVKLQTAAIATAAYPTPVEAKNAIAKVERHDTYFAILGAGIVTAWGFLLWVADKLWRVLPS